MVVHALCSLNRKMSPAPADELGYKPLDGGWGWVVVVGAHISIGFAYSTPKVLSIFFKDIQEDLGTSFSEIALISSIMLAAMYAGGELIESACVASTNGAPGVSQISCFTLLG